MLVGVVAVAQLIEAFREYAPVLEARVVRDRVTNASRGFAFVEFTSVEVCDATPCGLKRHGLPWSHDMVGLCVVCNVDVHARAEPNARTPITFGHRRSLCPGCFRAFRVATVRVAPPACPVVWQLLTCRLPSPPRIRHSRGGPPAQGGNAVDTAWARAMAIQASNVAAAAASKPYVLLLSSHPLLARSCHAHSLAGLVLLVVTGLLRICHASTLGSQRRNGLIALRSQAPAFGSIPRLVSILTKAPISTTTRPANWFVVVQSSEATVRCVCEEHHVDAVFFLACVCVCVCVCVCACRYST